MKLPAPQPYFSTDAGGTPSSAMRSLGQVPGVPVLEMPGLPDLVGLLTSSGLATVGVFTPWGELEPISGMQLNVRSIPRPEVNLVLFNAEAVQPVLDGLGLGRAPFLAMLSTAPLPNVSVEASVTDTPYELFGNGIACYRQDDRTGVPKMYFVYWLRERNPGDTAAGTSSPVLSANSLGATLNFAQQLDVNTSTLRNPPIVTVEEAASVQFPMVFPVPAPLPGALPPLPVPPPLPPPPGVPSEVVAFAECVSDWLGIPGAIQDPIGAITAAGAALAQCAAGIDVMAYAVQAQSNPMAAAQALMAAAKAACPSLPEPTNCLPETVVPPQFDPAQPPQFDPAQPPQFDPAQPPQFDPSQPSQFDPAQPLPQETEASAGTTSGASVVVVLGIGVLSALGTFALMKRRPRRG